MAKRNNVINLVLDTGTMPQQIQAVSGALGGLNRMLQTVKISLAGAFVVGQVGALLEESEALKKEFTSLHRATGRLKSALTEALAPIAQALLPIITQAVYSAARLIRYLGQVVKALLGGSESSGELSENMAAASQSAEKIKRSLAGFDQIQRIHTGTGLVSQVGTIEKELQEQSHALDLWQRMIVSKIESLLKPLNDIDFSNATKAFGELHDAISPVTRTLFDGLEWAWFNLLIPLGEWTIEDALPVFLQLLAAALEVLAAVIEAVKPSVSWLWENFLQPIAEWTGGLIIQILQGLTEKLKGVSQWINENQEVVAAATPVIAAFLAVWAGTQVTQWLTRAQGLPNFFGTLRSTIMLAVGALALLSPTAREAFAGIKKALKNVAGWLLENVVTPYTDGIKNCVNGIVAYFNSMLNIAAASLNTLTGAMNKLSFSVPSWVPGIGGQSFGFDIPEVTAPQIPYLAQGAVLPANKPFLAVVGDQTHGTNVEAPLATIQEAVAVVMDGYAADNLAGQELIVTVLREILEAVLGIQIGDAVIAQAAQRYQRKMAVVHGG